MFSETTELRRISEPHAAALAAERATDEQIESIVNAAYAMHPQAGAVEDLFSADCTFHATILEATGNLLMRQLRPIIPTMLWISYEYGVLAKSQEPVRWDGHIRVADRLMPRDAAAEQREMNTRFARHR